LKKLVAILGSGESGMGAAQLAAKLGVNVFLSDFGKITDSNKALLKKWGVEFEENGHSLNNILAVDLVVKSPGIPDGASVVQSIIQKGIMVISEIEYAFQNLNKGSKIIAITGTNGKTTTTLLTHHLFKTAGFNVALTGNVGISLAKVIAENPHDIYVVEVSSFQLDGIQHFKPEIAILLNITPDHLDRYNYSFEAYADAKFKISQNQTAEDCLIYCQDDETINIGLKSRRILAELLPVSITSTMENGAFFESEIFHFKTDNAHILPSDATNLIGKHNRINTMAAVLSALKFGISIDTIKKGLKTFINAPHRLEVIAEKDGILFINDSKATNVDSVYYALEGINRPIIWIAGGIDKGNDYWAIQELVEAKVKGLIALGIKNDPLVNYFEPSLDRIARTKNIEEAVSIAADWAVPGDVVLLSPACASFDLFKNYEDRGDQFRDAVLSYVNQKYQTQ